MIPYAEMIFGHSVAIENRTIVIGASKLNANTTHQGAAYVGLTSKEWNKLDSNSSIDGLRL